MICIPFSRSKIEVQRERTCKPSLGHLIKNTDVLCWWNWPFRFRYERHPFLITPPGARAGEVRMMYAVYLGFFTVSAMVPTGWEAKHEVLQERLPDA
jgi:hypothetical protein